MEWIEPGVNFNHADGYAVMVGYTLLQPTNCFVAISQTEVEESTPV
jgi:hypothetical protein